MKLFTMGIDYDHATVIIKNGLDEKYYSPIKECERPITALFHAVYSFIHILHLNNLIMKNYTANENISTFLSTTKDTLEKMQIGCEIIIKHIKTGHQGKLFVNEFIDWAEVTMYETKEILNKYGIAG